VLRSALRASFSKPSTMILASRTLPSRTEVWTMAADSDESAMPDTNDRSIFTGELDVAHEDCLGELQDQHGWVQATDVQSDAHFVDDLVPFELQSDAH
jgi:hypothetical protein